MSHSQAQCLKDQGRTYRGALKTANQNTMWCISHFHVRLFPSHSEFCQLWKYLAWEGNMSYELIGIIIWLRLHYFHPLSSLKSFSFSWLLKSLMLCDIYLHWAELHLENYFSVQLQESWVSREAGITVRRCDSKGKAAHYVNYIYGKQGNPVSHPSCEFFQQIKLWTHRLV